MDFRTIYATRAEDYDALVSREDYQGNILRALTDINPLEGLDVVELGAGTGRLTRLVAPYARSIRAFDAYAPMLEVARRKMAAVKGAECRLATADNKSIPAEDASADLSLAGWTFGHSTGWHPDSWEEEIGPAVDEMLRVLRPGGSAVVLETLGTGFETPFEPRPALGAYYRWLEAERGFCRTWVRTDYRFESAEEAERLVRFFFGDELAGRVRRDGLNVLPECTGIWSRAA